MVVMAGAVFLFGYKNSNNATEGHFIKIGALLPLSGNAANYGEGSREGIEIAKDDLKSKYLNLNIQVVYEDSFYDPRRAVDGYRKLKDISNISAILTGGSQISSAVKNLSDKDNVLQMAIWSGAPSYSSGVHNFNFRITALADEGGKVKRATFLGLSALPAQMESFTKKNGPFSLANLTDAAKALLYIVETVFSAKATASLES